MATSNEITQKIIDVWDEPGDPLDDFPRAEEEEPEPEEPESPGEPEDEPEVTTVTTEAEDEPEEEPEKETEEEEEPGEEEEEEEPEPTVQALAVEGFETEDPDIRQYLDRHGGDVAKALRSAAELQRSHGRLGNENLELRNTLAAAQQELERARLFAPQQQGASPEEVEWIGAAVDSGNPMAYIQQAVYAGQYGLARQVCEVWGQQDPFNAMRAAQTVDAAEYQAVQQQGQQQSFDPEDLMTVLREEFPDMQRYEEGMWKTMEELGDHHPLVNSLRSSDANEAARGVIGIFEITKARSNSVQVTRRKVQKQRADADLGKKRDAAVTSAQATPTRGETPRSPQVLPGLNLAELDEALQNY